MRRGREQEVSVTATRRSSLVSTKRKLESAHIVGDLF
jgi:hypothetical protein